MDFYHISERVKKATKEEKIDTLEIYPDFKACRSKELMIRGRAFYAIWDDEKQLWSTDEYDVQRLIDKDLYEYKRERQKTWEGKIEVKNMLHFSSNMWKNYRNFLREMSDCAHQLDEKLTFENSEVKKNDYVSKKLPYSLQEGSFDAYDELIGTLYDEEERQKLEWAIGAIVAGDAKNIQKFIVLYGEAGTGKSTFLNIVQKLFEGYYTTFEAKALTGNNNQFSTEQFKNNPLVAIQHDGDLSKIEDNTKLNSIISHEEMSMRELYKPSYTARVNSFLFMGTNQPVKISDAKSGIIRRLIDVRPSGKKVSNKKYQALVSQIDFELGAIAWHCLQVYKSMGKNYYSTYRPLEMMFQTDVFFNFVEANYYTFKELDATTLKQAYDMYKAYCEEALIDFKFPRHKFREELKSYFSTFSDYIRIDGKQVRSYYQGFLASKFALTEKQKEEAPYSLVIDTEESLLDKLLSSCPAQYANEKETPKKKWSEVKTKLSEIDTTKLHYMQPPLNHIVIDFDLKDATGEKSMEKNLEEASKWPPTYAEFSKSGAGIHLHYIYDGNVSKLSRVYSEGIEIKVFSGQASLRRKFSKSNNSPVITINSGLPLKGEKMINFDAVQSEKGLRDLILRNLNKEIHPGTKPSMDFIWKILDDAYKSGMKYDVTDLRPRILIFAINSSNQADYCVKLINTMHFASEEPSEAQDEYQSEELIFFDVEVFPNLFVVAWKKKGGSTVKMINPTASQMEELMRFKLVGFNCRRYDNHIIYARYIGYTNQQLFELSQKIIKESRNALFGEAYNLSYTDIYDFSSKKQSLKKFQIDLGIHHQELGLPWDQPVPEHLWPKVADYCGNDVESTEVTFDDRKQDYVARLILAELSGLSPNDTTQMHTAKIMFGNDKRPQDHFVYTDLSKDFPGYTFDNGKSSYRGEDPGEGGYVYSEPGMYANAAILDIISQHPTSLIILNAFGKYTQTFKELVEARVAIKHKDYDSARKMLGGALSKYLQNEEDSKDLAYSLKIVINIVYGLTSAKFENKFKDPRNKDNIVAKRGALFMIDLKHAVQEKGFTVAHIKTDSIKIPNATPEIIQFVHEFGKKYGYTFEHEDTYSKICLVNDAVYIAKSTMGDTAGQWIATGAQFAQPYVFKTLFSKEKIEFDDMCETKSVTSALYLDMNEKLGEDEHDYHFIGKVGRFCPVWHGSGGGVLLREKDGKYYAATGSKGYRWLEAETVKLLNKEEDINKGYYDTLVNEAVEDISKYGDFEWFTSDVPESLTKEENPIGFNDEPLPWESPCGEDISCIDCPSFGDAKCKEGYDIKNLKGELLYASHK